MENKVDKRRKHSVGNLEHGHGVVRLLTLGCFRPIIMDLASKVEFLKFHQGYVRGVAFSPVVRFKLINTKLYQSGVEILLSFYSAIVLDKY